MNKKEILLPEIAVFQDNRLHSKEFGLKDDNMKRRTLEGCSCCCQTSR